MTAPFRPPLPSDTELWQCYAEYERRKNEWMLEHPGSKPEEYQQAIQRIARECGV